MSQERYHPRMDQGEATFRFTVLAGNKSEVVELTDRKAQYKNESPLAVSYFPAGQGNHQTMPFSVRGVRMDAMKKSDDGKAYILRLFNYKNEAVTAEIVIDRFKINSKISFCGYELMTLRVENGSLSEVSLLDED